MNKVDLNVPVRMGTITDKSSTTEIMVKGQRMTYCPPLVDPLKCSLSVMPIAKQYILVKI